MPDTRAGAASVLLGEVHTALLQSSVSLPPAACERLVRLVGGERVRRYERPIAHTASPDVLTGVDCRLPARSGARARAIGTVASRSSITGGHVVQGSARAGLVRSAAGRRLAWSYYLARPGQVSVIGTAAWTDLAQGFVALAGPAPEVDPETLVDLGAVSARMVDEVQRSAAIDRRAPFPAGRTRLRWAAVVVDGEPAESIRFATSGGEHRTLLVHCGPERAAHVAAFAEDLALHDWLLTALLRLIERSRLGIDDRSTVLERLRPAVENLLHLWMPAARLDEAATQLWRGLERRPGIGRQWESAVNRIRDQLALCTIDLLGDRLGEAAR